MAYYQFDLTFTNLGALPASTYDWGVRFFFSDSTETVTRYFEGPFPASQAITVDTRNAEPDSPNPPPAFELSASAYMWVEMQAYRMEGGDFFTVLLHTLGPYTVGDVGTEVPPP